MLSVGSLFAGIGGIDLGLERTGGFRTAWFSEIDPFANAVLRKHWPGVPNLGDVTLLDGDDIPGVDVLAGGFPCQPVSLAGKRLAQDDPRWLWPHVARLVGLLRPRYVLLENVPGLRSKGLGDVLQDLSALGYDAEWEGIPAAAVGAPHRRDRVWVVAYPRREWSLADTSRVSGPIGGEAGHLASSPRTPEGLGEQRERSGNAVDHRGTDVADADRAGRKESGFPLSEEASDASSCGCREVPNSERSGLQRSARSGDTGARRAGVFTTRSGERSWQAVESDLGRAPHGVSAWLDGSWEREIPRIEKGIVNRTPRLKSLGNAVVPQVAEVVGHLILADYESAR